MSKKIFLSHIIFTLSFIYPVFAEDEKKSLTPPNFYIDKSAVILEEEIVSYKSVVLRRIEFIRNNYFEIIQTI